MAFSLRRMFSNISYFKKSEDNPNADGDEKRINEYVPEKTVAINYETNEPDSTSRQCTSLNIPESVKKFTANKASLSDTDLLTLGINTPVRHRRKKCKKLTVDIKKATHSMSERLNVSTGDESCSSQTENTPKHILLECVNSDIFKRSFDMNKTFGVYDGMTDDQLSSQFEDENFDIESLSDHSDSDVSVDLKTKQIKMCRKVESVQYGSSSEENRNNSVTPNSFEDIEIDKTEEERMKLLYNYQSKLGKIEGFLKDMLSEFQFHIEVSKIFKGREISIDQQCEVDGNKHSHDTIRRPSPTDSWSIIMEKENDDTKVTVRKQLQSIKQSIEEFINVYLQNYESETKIKKCRKYKPHSQRGISSDKRAEHCRRKHQMNNKKKMKYYDFPDLREAMINLFYPDTDQTLSSNVTSDTDESVSSKCSCQCHNESSPNTYSGLISKTNDGSISNQSITSSIGNFSLDSSTLTAYSESLDQIISYNSFHDTSLYYSMLQKPTMERITFYVQVHSIQLKCDSPKLDFESKNIVTFFCPSCKSTESDENGLINHILSQSHCEKIHFQYKTVYIKKCVSEGREIQPSTILNPMKLYRDDNKIVCFGDAMYACSLCFENLIVGESMLMAHCADKEHVERREKLSEVIESHHKHERLARVL